MRRISIVAASFIFAAVFSASAFAQAAQPGAGKIGFIVTAAFDDDKVGITKIVNAQKALEAEFKPRQTELQGIQTKLKTISDDLAKMGSNPAVPVDQKVVAAKQDEGQRLQREFEFKQKEAQAAFGKRQDELLGPIMSGVYTALQEYAKTKGYSVIIDLSTLCTANQPSPVLVLEPTSDITKDFVTFYNARPGTTATAATPK